MWIKFSLSLIRKRTWQKKGDCELRLSNIRNFLYQFYPIIFDLPEMFVELWSLCPLNGTTSQRQEDHAFFFHAILFEAEPNKYDCITYMANVGSTYQINCSSHHIW